MSWSLEIANGDLSIGSQGLNTVTGGTKVVQDLSCAVLEPMGTDLINPSFGSIIDGGVDTDGTVYYGFIGQINNPSTAAAITGEIQRIIRLYQAEQIARNQADVMTYGSSTLSVDEALLSVGNISPTMVGDQIYLLVTLQTGANTELPVVIPLGTGQ